MFILSLKQDHLVRLLRSFFWPNPSIRDLEEELGVLLFERSNTGAKLTDDGHDFLKYAKRILRELDLLKGRYHKSFKKSFTIASHHYDFLSLPMAHIAKRFRSDYQEFQLI